MTARVRIRAKGATLATAMTYDYADPLTPDHAPGAVTAAGVTTPFTYDANGNMLTGLAGKIMTYDGENRPLSVTHLGKRTCYVYGVDGKRLKKVEGLAPTQDCTALPANANTTVYFGAVEVRNWLVAGEQVLTYPHPAVKLLNGTTPAAATYLHRDGLASVRAITNAAGVKIEAALYKPFGEQSEWVLPGNAAPETKGWIGERYDADAGLQYLNARYYDPELSLFLQPDWWEVTKAGVGTNRFSYSFNDPVNKFDPGGNQTKEVKKKELENAVWMGSGMGRRSDGSRQTQGEFNNTLGRVFESAVLRSLGSSKLGNPFNAPAREEDTSGKMSRVLPDAARKIVGGLVDQLPGMQIGVNASVGNAGGALLLTEVKAKNGTITLSRNDWKIKAMIDVLSKAKVGNGVPTLEVVGVAETKIATSVVDYATERGVLVAQRTGMYDAQTGEFQASSATLHNQEVIPPGLVPLDYFTSPGRLVGFWE